MCTVNTTNIPSAESKVTVIDFKCVNDDDMRGDLVYSVSGMVIIFTPTSKTCTCTSGMLGILWKSLARLSRVLMPQNTVRTCIDEYHVYYN